MSTKINYCRHESVSFQSELRPAVHTLAYGSSIGGWYETVTDIRHATLAEAASRAEMGIWVAHACDADLSAELRAGVTIEIPWPEANVELRANHVEAPAQT